MGTKMHSIPLKATQPPDWLSGKINEARNPVTVALHGEDGQNVSGVPLTFLAADSGLVRAMLLEHDEGEGVRHFSVPVETELLTYYVSLVCTGWVQLDDDRSRNATILKKLEDLLFVLRSQIKLETTDTITFQAEQDLARTDGDVLVVDVAVVKRMDVRLKKLPNSTIKRHLEAIEDIEASNDPLLLTDARSRTKRLGVRLKKLDRSSLIHQEENTSSDGDSARSKIIGKVGEGSLEEDHSLSSNLESDTNNNPDKSIEVEMDVRVDKSSLDKKNYPSEVSSHCSQSCQDPSKRCRTVISSMQTKLMRHLFQIHKNLGTAECQALAQLIGLPDRVVQSWFYNNRYKDRKARITYQKTQYEEKQYEMVKKKFRLDKVAPQSDLISQVLTSDHLDRVRSALERGEYNPPTPGLLDSGSVLKTVPITSAVPASVNSRMGSDCSSSASHREAPQQQPRSSASSYPTFDRGAAVTGDVMKRSTFVHPYQTENCQKMKKCRVSLKKVDGKSLNKY